MTGVCGGGEEGREADEADAVSGWDGTGRTYGAESLVCVCFHAEETRFHLVVAEQRWVELDAHDLWLTSRTLDLVFQVHPLTKASIHVKKKNASLVPVHVHTRLAGWGDGTTRVVDRGGCARTLVSMESIVADDTFPFTFPKCL